MKTKLPKSLKNPVLIIDSNNIAHRARHTMGPLSYKGTPTGVIYGFLNQIFRISAELKPSNIVFAWDSKKSKRRRVYSEYKRNRNHDDEGPDEELLEAFFQFGLLQKQILPALGFCNNYMQVGFEADDLIAKASTDINQNNIIVSNDDDLLQLLSKKTRIYNLGRSEIYTEEKFVQDYGIQVSQWPDVKRIAGCKGDNVPGVPGVGEKTAIKYLKGNLKTNTKAYKNIQEHQEMIKNNDVLVRLPFPGVKEIELKQTKFSSEALRQICIQYGFQKMKNNIDDWEVLFGR